MVDTDSAVCGLKQGVEILKDEGEEREGRVKDLSLQNYATGGVR